MRIFSRFLVSLILSASLVGLAAPAQAQEVPANDQFSAAILVSELPYKTATHNELASTAEDEPTCFNAGRTLWWSVTAAKNQRIYASTYASDHDTVMAVYIGQPGSFAEVACVDDYSSYEKAAALGFEAEKGTTYHVMVGSLSTEPSGLVKLQIEASPGAPANDTLAEAKAITRLPFKDSVYTAEARNDDEMSGSCASDTRSVFYRFKNGSKARSLRISTWDTDYDTTLAIFRSTKGRLANVACVRSSKGGHSRAGTVLKAEPRVTYVFRVGSEPDSYGRTLQFWVSEKAPPFNMKMKLDAGGLVSDVTGSARIKGVITCSRPTKVRLQGEIRQINGRRVAEGYFERTIKCEDGSRRWSAVIRARGIVFEAGSVGAEVVAYSYEPRRTKQRRKIVELTTCHCKWGV